MAKTRLTYLFVLIMAGLGALAFGSRWAFVVLYAVLMLPLAALGSLAAYPYSVAHRARYPQGRVFSGESGIMTVSMRNRGLVSYPDVRLELRESLAVRTDIGEEEASGAVTMPARKNISVSYQMRFPYRGVYTIGLKSVTATDFLGLFRMNFKEKIPVRVVVFPRLIPEFTIPTDAWRMNEGSLGYDRFSEDLTDVSDVRKHDPSDDYRKIHWKLTAKRGEFIVKNFHSPGVSLTMIFVDTAYSGLLGQRRAALEDTMTSLAASAAEHCIRTRQGARLVVSDLRDSDTDITLPEDMEKTLLTLAMLDLDDDAEALPRRLEQVLMSKETFAGMAVVTARLTAPLCELLQAAFSAGHEVYLYYVHSTGRPPTKEEYDVLDQLAVYGIAVELVLPNQ